MHDLDNAATTPMREEAITAYSEAARGFWGNSQSLHNRGEAAAILLERCRQKFAEFFGVRKEGIYFTGSASEGNERAIRSVLRASDRRVIITSKLEHASVLHTVMELAREGYTVRWISCSEDGQLCYEHYCRLLEEDPALVIIQHVNSEMGAVQDVERFALKAKEKGIPFHSDLVQSFGKITIPSFGSGITSAVISAHKFYGPKGIGIVYIDPGLRWIPLTAGTTHENGFRMGTVDVPGIAAATIAAEYALAEQQANARHAAFLREKLSRALQEIWHSVKWIESKGGGQSPFIAGLLLPTMEGQWCMLACNRSQVAISTGTACQVGEGEAVTILGALGYDRETAGRFIRVSFSGRTEEADVNAFLSVMKTLSQSHSYEPAT